MFTLIKCVILIISRHQRSSLITLLHAKQKQSTHVEKFFKISKSKSNL